MTGAEMGDTPYPCLKDRKEGESEKNALGRKPVGRRKEKTWTQP